MSPPSISVIIPVYDREAFVGAAIESLRSQDYAGESEVIVVDDGSHDRSAAVAAAIPGVRVVRQENRGPSAARNRGLAVATGDLVAFLDADDLAPPWKLRVQVEYLEAHPEVGAVLGRQEILLPPGAAPPAWLYRDPVYGDPGGVNPVTVMASRAAVLGVGGYDERLRAWEGRDLLIRLRGAGVDVGVVDEIVLYRRIHDTNVSHSMSGGGEELLQTLRASMAARRRTQAGPA